MPLLQVQHILASYTSHHHNRSTTPCPSKTKPSSSPAPPWVSSPHHPPTPRPTHSHRFLPKGIGAAIAHRLHTEGANLILLARNKEKLTSLATSLTSPSSPGAGKVAIAQADVRSYPALSAALTTALSELSASRLDVLINNAGLALGAPKTFWEQDLADIDQMHDTNIRGFMYAARAALTVGGMAAAKAGVILNITSTTGLEIPPFPGEAVYHMSKAAQEAFSNVLRAELTETNVRVCTLRPGVVATHFHRQRVQYDDGLYQEFMEGMQPLVAEDVAEACAGMLVLMEQRGVGVCVRSVDVIPTAQRTLQVFDRTWNKRNGVEGK